MNKKKLFSALIALCASMFIGSIVLTLSWFVPNNFIAGTNMSGSVLKEYFHPATWTEGGVEVSSDGSEEHPYVITKPKHYENMIKLQYEMDGFWCGLNGSDEGYYFQIGWDIDGNGALEVYDSDTTGALIFDSDGELTYNATTLNIGKDLSLPPIGSESKPFCAHLDGNGFTIANFVVDGEGYSDIGIFGFVSEKGTCNNTYFSDFVVDVSGATIPENDLHNNTKHTNDMANVGYIAGHIYDAATFTDVYVNNCNYRGNNNSQNATDMNNMFGYYGCVDKDALGGTTGKGTNYSFTLDAQACYDTMNNIYDDIEGDNLVLRNQKIYDQTTEEYLTDPDTGEQYLRTSKTFADAVEHNTTYDINGGNPNPNSSNRNYSLSSLGYVSPHFVDEESDYYVYYKNGSSYVVPNEKAVVTNYSMHDNPEGSGDDDAKYFFYFDSENSKWVYYKSNNRLTGEDGEPLTVNFGASVAQFDIGTGLGSAYKPSSGYNASLTLYIDDQTYVLNASCTLGSERTLLIFTKYYFNFSITSRTITLDYGIHHIAAEFQLNYTLDGTSYTTYSYFGDSTTGNTVTQKAVEIDAYSQRDGLSVSLSAPGANKKTVAQESFDYEQTTYVDLASTQYDVYALKINGENDVSGVYTLLNTQRATFNYDPSASTYSNWIAHAINRVQDSAGEYNHWIADEPEMVNSGYSAENIDVVGDMSFYARSILGFNIKVINLPTESSSNPITMNPSSKIGQKFYASDCCPDSVVLMINNTENALDNVDAQLGEISFEYVQGNILSWLGITVATPSFKKGNGVFKSLSAAGTAIPDASPTVGALESIVAVTLKESQIKGASYCALDKDGIIIGTYDTNGNPTSGSFADENTQAKIATYVLCIGAEDNGSLDFTWITKVDFSYKATKGSGGVFGSVGYRSSPDTVESTVLNFYISIPSGNANYSIGVVYTRTSENSGSYAITVECDLPVSITIHLYDTTNYSVTLNGVAAQLNTELTVNSTSYVYSSPHT